MPNKTKLNAAAALNASNETKGGELNQGELNNTQAEQGTQGTQAPAEQGEQGKQGEPKGVKFTLNTPNPAFLNYLGTRDDDFASEFEKFASEFDSSEFTRPSNVNAGKAFDSLLNLLISAEFLLNGENFGKYMAEKNPIADYTKPAIANALCYARAQLTLLSEFGNRAEKAYQNFNRANKEQSKAELKTELQREKDAAAAAQAAAAAAQAAAAAKIAELQAKLAAAAAAAAAQNESKGA